MASSAALRQRRYRAHKAGDHSLCGPERGCKAGQPAVTSPVTPAVTRDAGNVFGPRAQQLWSDLAGEKTDGGRRVLLEEACRIVDRLDQLDELLSGELEALLRFRISDDGTEVTVTINNVMAEARQQAAVLKQLVAELRQDSTKPADKPGPSKGGSGIADLTARIAARRTGAAG